MASIPVTIIGTMTYTDVGVGGGPMPGGPTPMPPIYYPPAGKPPGIWGGPPAYVDIGGPGPQPGPSHPIIIPPDSLAPGVPSHPIYIPPSVWPGPGQPSHPIVIPPDSLAPGVPTHPIYIPVYPGHPIIIPPDAVSPGVPAHPIVLPPPDLGIWPSPGAPSHPIVLPPTPPSGPPTDQGNWAFVPGLGWIWVPASGTDKPHPPQTPA
jgi:hypothetical protein